jgi:hypothetical protein
VTLAIQAAQSNSQKVIFFLTQFFQNSIPFVNCSLRIAGSMSNRKGRTTTMATKKAAKKAPAKKAAKKKAQRRSNQRQQATH